MPMKVYYFEMYARAEPIRMALHKAGVEFENIRLTGQAYQDFKASGKSEFFGKMPVLELEDGTTLSETSPILQYIGAKYNLLPTDPLVNWQGDSFASNTVGNVFSDVTGPIFSSADDRQDKLAAAVEKRVIPWYTQLEGRLKDRKFICGETITIHDFRVAGPLTNLVCNEKAKDAEYWKTVWAKAPERVVKYYNDFCAEMKDYLDARPKDCTM